MSNKKLKTDYDINTLAIKLRISPQTVAKAIIDTGSKKNSVVKKHLKEKIDMEIANKLNRLIGAELTRIEKEIKLGK